MKCQHCHLSIYQIKQGTYQGVYVDDTGGDVCSANKFMEENKNGEHQP